MSLHRAAVSECLAIADTDELLAVADACLTDTPPPTFLRGPDVGMVMMTVREPVEATRFHLGEVLVTRTEVQHRGERGWAMRMGDDPAGSLAAAVCDAEFAAGGGATEQIIELCQRTRRTVDAQRAAEWAELEPTIVRFEEMEA